MTLKAGRPDFSSTIARVVMPTIKKEQSHYWGVITFSLDPLSYAQFALEAGFSPTQEWVPEDHWFVLKVAELTGDVNSLVLLKVLKEKKGDPTLYSVGWKYGYGSAAVASDRSHRWVENERPVYEVWNFNSRETVNYVLNIYGIIELII